MVVLDAQREELEERGDLKEGGAVEGGGVAVPWHGVLRLQPVDRIDDVAVLVHVLPRRVGRAEAEGEGENLSLRPRA